MSERNTWEVGWWHDDRECQRVSGFSDGRTHRGIIHMETGFGLCLYCDEDQIANRMSHVEDALIRIRDMPSPAANGNANALQMRALAASAVRKPRS